MISYVVASIIAFVVTMLFTGMHLPLALAAVGVAMILNFLISSVME